MARTPLMHALRQLAAEHAAARRLGLPVAEVRGSTRRQLLGRAAALGLGTAVASAAAAPALAHAVEADKKPVTPARVAIVGAGISGLTAALTLKDAGVPFTLYEANPSRVGGRMWSQRSLWAYGQTSEIGGELIDTSHKKILELCRRFNLPTEDFLGGGPNGAEEVLWFNGTYYPREQADVDFNAVYQALRRDLQEAGEVSWNSTTPAGTALDNMTLHQWIETRIPGGHGSRLGRFIDVAYNVEYGADTDQQSALALVLLMGYQPNPGNFNVWGLSNERYHITGGNDQLPNAIAQALPAGSTVMGRELVAVRVSADGTQTLTFNDAGATRTVVADHTILCLPLPILQRIDITGAGFDPLMKNLLRDARMGYCTKLNMQFTSRPWRGTGPWPGSPPGTASPTARSSRPGTPPRSSRATAASCSSTAAAPWPARSPRRPLRHRLRPLRTRPRGPDAHRDRRLLPRHQGGLERQGADIGLAPQSVRTGRVLVLADRLPAQVRQVRGHRAGPDPHRRRALQLRLPGVHGRRGDRGGAGGEGGHHRPHVSPGRAVRRAGCCG